MQTIGWSDVNHVRDTGPAQMQNKRVTIDGENIAKWMEDPDGRFEVVPAADDDTPAALGRFYPSL